MNFSIRWFLKITLAAASLFPCGCSENQPHEIKQIRVVDRPPMDAHKETTTEKRFNLNRTAFGSTTQALANPHSNPFHWELPAGWQELPATSMRLINLGVDNVPEIETYVSLLPGAGGDLLANTNRWRKQMGLEEINPDEARQLPEVTILGRPAKFIELEGDFTAMSGTKMNDFFLLGIIGEYNGQSLFIKMTGPKKHKDKQAPNFISFTQSLHPAAMK